MSCNLSPGAYTTRLTYFVETDIGELFDTPVAALSSVASVDNLSRRNWIRSVRVFMGSAASGSFSYQDSVTNDEDITLQKWRVSSKARF